MRTPPTVTLPPKRARIELAGSPPLALSLAAKKAGISLPVTIFDFLASAMFTALELGNADTDMSGAVAGARVRRLVVRVAGVVAVHVAHEDDVDLAQPRIARAGDGAARVVEDARAVRVLEDQRAILRAELAVDAAQRRHLHGLGHDGKAQCGAQSAHGCEPGRTIHGGFHPLLCEWPAYHRRTISSNGIARRRCPQRRARYRRLRHSDLDRVDARLGQTARGVRHGLLSRCRRASA